MNKINLQHAGWADLLDEIRSMDPDFDSVLRRAGQLIQAGRQGPAKEQVLRHIDAKGYGSVLGEVA